MSIATPPKDVYFNGVATNAYAVTPDTNNDLPQLARALWVGAAGNLVVIPAGSTSSVTLIVTGSQLVPLAVSRVLATSTAGSIVALV